MVVVIVIVYIHTCHSFLFPEISEFLWSMEVSSCALQGDMHGPRALLRSLYLSMATQTEHSITTNRFLIMAATCASVLLLEQTCKSYKEHGQWSYQISAISAQLWRVILSHFFSKKIA